MTHNENWFKKHVDTAIILGAFGTSVLWMNGKFSDIEKDIAGLKTEVAVVKTVLLMKNILPAELANNECKKD
jgi:hypothetical protein